MLQATIPLAISILAIVALILLMIVDWSDERRYKFGMLLVALATIAIMFNQYR